MQATHTQQDPDSLAVVYRDLDVESIPVPQPLSDGRNPPSYSAEKTALLNRIAWESHNTSKFVLNTAGDDASKTSSSLGASSVFPIARREKLQASSDKCMVAMKLMHCRKVRRGLQ